MSTRGIARLRVKVALLDLAVFVVPIVAVVGWVWIAPIGWFLLTVPEPFRVFQAVGCFCVVWALTHLIWGFRSKHAPMVVVNRRASAGKGQLAQTARHEAAHAVVAWALGAKVERVTICPSGEDGMTACSYPGHWSAPREAWTHLVVAVAGNEADLAAGIHDLGSFVDIQQAQVAAAALISTGQLPEGVPGLLSTDALLAAARAAAADILDAHSHTVEQVAAELCHLQAHPLRRRWLSPSTGTPIWGPPPPAASAEFRALVHQAGDQA